MPVAANLRSLTETAFATTPKRVDLRTIIMILALGGGLRSSAGIDLKSRLMATQIPQSPDDTLAQRFSQPQSWTNFLSTMLVGPIWAMVMIPMMNLVKGSNRLLFVAAGNISRGVSLAFHHIVSDRLSKVLTYDKSQFEVGYFVPSYVRTLTSLSVWHYGGDDKLAVVDGRSTCGCDRIDVVANWHSGVAVCMDAWLNGVAAAAILLTDEKSYVHT